MKTELQKFMADLVQECEGKSYLFRGTTLQYSEEGATEINSSLYRWAVGENFVFYEKYRPFDIEQEIVERAKKHFPDSTSNIEILTDLQHYRGKTNLMDFSRSLYKALYFACDGDFEEDGELICLESSMGEEKNIDYKRLKQASVTLPPFMIEPAGTQTSQRRVIAQDSVFVYAPKGFLEQGDLKIIPIPHDLKEDILVHLKEFHNTDVDTIYNDLMGFIANEEGYKNATFSSCQCDQSTIPEEIEQSVVNHSLIQNSKQENDKMSVDFFNQGLANHKNGEWESAIENYDRAIKLNPYMVEAYYSRGIARDRLGRKQEAIEDFDKTIELNPNHANGYYCRGHVKSVLGENQEALEDLNKAIKLNPEDAYAYYRRGMVKDRLNKQREAIEDFNKVIELDSNYIDVYNNRGIAKGKLTKYREAIIDFKQAIESNPDSAEAHYNLGYAKYHLGDYEEAIENLKSAKELAKSEKNTKLAEQAENMISQCLIKLGKLNQ